MNFDVKLFPVETFIAFFERKKLDLEPAFQRKSVWKKKDRQNLILSILENYTIPSIFLCKGEDNKYLVIDGKQRLESIFAFCGFIRGERFSVKLHVDKDQYHSQKVNLELDFKKLQKYKEYYTHFLNYRIPVIILSDYSLQEMKELFVRINSTGKFLTKTEIINAKYMNSNFLKNAKKLANKNFILKFFEENKILTHTEISRMKNLEIICEIMAFIIDGSILDKRKVMDNILRYDQNKTNIKKAIKRVPQILKNISKILPEFSSTRFKQLSDFYSLAYFVYDLTENEKKIINAKNSKVAKEILTEFSNQMDSYIHSNKETNKELCERYFYTINSATDTKSHRQERFKILKDLLDNVFVETKDTNRLFSSLQKRLIWNASKTKKCKNCGTKLTFDSATFDHIKPWSCGGKTVIKNAQLLCKSCNSQKGNKY